MKNITLMPNPYRDRGFQITQQAEQILKSKGVHTRICLPFHVDKSFEIPYGVSFVTIEEALRDCDLLICFGGDGTLLHAAKMVGSRNIPLLGINTGNMGFMAELESDELELLSKLATDQYSIDTRMMLHVKVKRGSSIVFEDHALNDAVITKGAVARVIQATVRCDGVEAMQFDGDGVILCTPTGSTAYSMSAGGPIVEPSARNTIITPICAHALHTKSLVLAPERVATVHLSRTGKRNAFLSVDGGKAYKLTSDDVVIVTESRRVARLVKLKDTSFYQILSKKFQG